MSAQLVPGCTTQAKILKIKEILARLRFQRRFRRLKSRFPLRVRAKRNSSVLLVLALIAMASATPIGCIGSRTAADPTPAQRLQQALKRRDALEQAQLVADRSPAAGMDPTCPPLNASMVPSTPPANGGHHVTLTWKASAPADSKHSAAFGYCIYRGAAGDPNPGLINKVPILGTSCIDDLVANGGRYSYVVRAISAGGATSVTSNPAPVAIPPTGSSKSPISAASPPLCRGPAGK
jgi:hypothetical protein